MDKIWIIGGTTETHEVANKLLESNKDFVITVATTYGLEEFAQFSKYLIQKRLTKDEMIDFCKEKNITIIADISHPYAREVSQNAIDTAKILGLKYLRYERQNSSDSTQNEKIHYVDSHKEAISLIKQKNFRTILLTTGINNAFDYINAELPNLFIRILPRSEQIKMLEDANLPSKNIIAMQGPFSYEMNTATIKYCNANVLVTKQSGIQGGYDEKIKACIDLNIDCIVIKRPDINYENKHTEITHFLDELTKN